MKAKVVLSLAGFLIFAIGVVTGIEYQSYKVRSAFSEAFKTEGNNNSSTTTESTSEEAPERKYTEKEIGEEIQLATLNYTVNEVTEEDVLTAEYSTPKSAAADAKFVVIDITLTNTTKGEYMFSPDEAFRLVDNSDREFTTYSESIGSIDNYLNYTDLSPSIKKTGKLVYEIPKDTTSYNLISRKAETEEYFRTKLK